MEKPAHNKSKNKKAAKPQAKPKITKQQKNDGPTCSMFLTELTRKLALKKREEENSTKNIVQKIIDSITKALPVKFCKRSPSKKDSPMKIETLQTYAPELLPNDIIEVPHPVISNSNILTLNEDNLTVPFTNTEVSTKVKSFKIPKMPLVSSDVFKQPDRRIKVVMEDIAVNTGDQHDLASEIAKHVGTLRKISLIAEEFNQKTAKNLKEIVDSVQEDLLKKL